MKVFNGNEDITNCGTWMSKERRGEDKKKRAEQAKKKKYYYYASKEKDVEEVANRSAS